MHRTHLGVWSLVGLTLLSAGPPALAADPQSASQETTAATVAGGKKITWKRHVLDTKFRSEGVCVGDFNHDGKPDIAAGSVWYEAPDWKMHSFLDAPKEFDPHGYSDSFCCYAEDLNGDGWDDLIVVDFPGKSTWWFENPKDPNKPFIRHEITPVTNDESPAYLPLTKGGKSHLICGVSPDPKNPDAPERTMAILTRQADPLLPWTIQSISATGPPAPRKFSHGLGVGDIEGNGRNDVLVREGWWEAPAETTKGEWKFHPADFGAECSQMYVYDFNGDGLNDVLSASAHRRGIWWHEQLKDGGWKTHEISNLFSQTHALCLADINGDGLPDIVTGKRWWAHGPTGDDSPGDPAVLFWFELTHKPADPQTKTSEPVWIPHEIDHDSGVGTQFQVVDVNGDGLLDVVVSNKKGVFYFEQVRE